MGRRTQRGQKLKAAVFVPSVAQFKGHWILPGTGPAQGHEAASPGTLGPSFRGLRLGPPHPLSPIGQSRLQSTVPETLPPAAEQDSCLLDFDELLNRWETTSGAAYVPKTHGDIYGQPSYRLTPMIERAVGIKDLGEKIAARPFRRPLSMAYQKSETRDKYQGWPNLGPETILRVGPQPWELADHHAQGPSQAMIPTTKNPVLAGKPFHISDQGVLDRQQPYMTTTARAHRLFTKKQLGICRPKSVKKTLQQSCAELNRRTVKTLPRAVGISQTQTRVPHRGALSLTQESFVAPQHPMSLPDRFCPLEAPWVAQRQAIPSLQNMPHLYRTESSRYGSLKPTFV
ncbi:uncharacterized protein SAXO3 isoform X2 [Monodelphis domestica]|uniref:uncharacterized protein SAXO3 isoform X2 n=1 Tax=Monodelphis domestica TaxID=13616 RepID=UPI0024E21366|nr:uncharacterized protein SAXO3 isoform X2 [Monodelphis domestica]